MANYFLLEAVNLFLGDHDPAASNHLELTSLKLPELAQKTIEHTAGGSVGSVNFAIPSLDALEPSAKLGGFNAERLSQFGLNSPYRSVFTAYGVIREKRSNKEREAKAIIEARLATIAPDEFSQGSEFGHDLTFKEVVSYSLFEEGREVFAWDWFARTWRVGGVDQLGTSNRILRIPGA